MCVNVAVVVGLAPSTFFTERERSFFGINGNTFAFLEYSNQYNLIDCLVCVWIVICVDMPHRANQLNYSIPLGNMFMLQPNIVVR